MINKIRLILVTEERKILEQDKVLGLSLALGNIASYLRDQGIEVLLTDTNKTASECDYSEYEIERISNVYDKGMILQYLKDGNNETYDQIARMFLGVLTLEEDGYGISIGADFSLLQIHLGFILAKYIIKTTGKVIFIGGNNISYLYIFKEFYKELLECVVENFDYIIKGPGERVIYELIQGINEGKNKSYFKNMDGLLYIEDGVIQCNKEREPIVIKPNWDSLDLSDYRYAFLKNFKENETLYYKFPNELGNKVIEFNRNNIIERKLIIPYIFNYNCIYQCAFCTQSDSERSGFIVGEVKKVVDDIEFLSNKYNSNYFYFLNNYFPSSLNFIKAFKEELENRNLRIYWSDCGRINGLTLEKLQLLYECGCRKLVFGFESASNKILELIDKRIKIQNMIQVLEWCKEVGIWADLEIIIGLPYEREDEFMDTYNFLKKHQRLINNFWLNEYFVVPNSLIGKYPEKYGVELIYNSMTYKKLLEKNKDGFLYKNYKELGSNARLWGFNEVREGNRTYTQMRAENIDKIIRLSNLRNPEFNQLFDFYNKVLRLRQSETGSK